MTGEKVRDGLQMMSGDDESLIFNGTVKWFDATRGFGFVTCEGVEGDVLLHTNVLRNFGQNAAPEGARVTLEVQETTRGFQAVRVIALAPPIIDAATALVPEFMQPVPEGTPFQAARVKWFDRSKGFGFANAFGSTDDIFVHAEVLRRFGLADLQPGEAICVRVIEGARGLLAAEVQRWEYYEAEPRS